MEDKYKDFAHKYDLFSGGFGNYSENYREFFKTLFTKQNVRSILDCACGTGNDIYLFKQLGMDAVGSDLSESMLQQARKNFESVGESIELHRLDFRDLHTHFERKFDAVVCLSTSIWHLSDEDEVVRAYSSMRTVLSEDGIMIVTQGTSDRQWNEKPRFILALDKLEITRLFVIDYPEKGIVFNVIDILREGEKYKLETWKTEYPIVLLRDDHERLLRAAGFSQIEFFGSYDFEQYDKEKSNRLIAVSRR